MDALAGVYALSARLLLRSRRTIFMALLCALPVALSALAVAGIQLRIGGDAPTAFGAASQIMTLFYLQFLLLTVTLFYGTALIGDEVEERTITYLFVRPVPRAAIFAGKYLAALTVTGALILPSATVSFAILTSLDSAEEAAAHVVVLAKDLGILALGAAAYAALFGWFGAYFKRPLLLGLVFCLGWESVVTYIPGYLSRFTVMHYLQVLIPHPTGQRGILQVFQQGTSVPVAIVTLLAIGAGFVALACYTVSRKQYVLEA